MVGDEDTAAVGLMVTNDVFEQDGLAGAGPADDCEEVAAVDFEFHATENAVGTEGLVKSLDVDFDRSFGVILAVARRWLIELARSLIVNAGVLTVCGFHASESCYARATEVVFTADV